MRPGRVALKWRVPGVGALTSAGENPCGSVVLPACLRRVGSVEVALDPPSERDGRDGVRHCGELGQQTRKSVTVAVTDPGTPRVAAPVTAAVTRVVTPLAPHSSATPLTENVQVKLAFRHKPAPSIPAASLARLVTPLVTGPTTAKTPRRGEGSAGFSGLGRVRRRRVAWWALRGGRRTRCRRR